MTPENVIIIGGGPAAYTAAIYAARAALSPLCIEGYAAGGQLLNTPEVENFPGFVDPVGGADLTMNMRAQAERYGARFVMRDVTRVDFSARPLRVWIGDEEHSAHAVIVATGATARTLGLPSEEAYQGRGVAYCSICDGPMFAGKRLVVVGGGDAALEEAMSLTKFASEVTIVHRRDEFRASKIMVRYARETEGLSFMTPYTVEEVLGDNVVTGVRLRNAETGETHVKPVDGMFVAIGHNPNTELVREWLEHDASGYLRVRPGSSLTNIEGVFAAGDVQDTVYRQAVTSAGSGCMAALDAERYLLRTARAEDADDAVLAAAAAPA